MNKKSLNIFNILNFFFIILSLFLFLYTFYRAEIFYESKQSNYYLKHYLLFLFSFIFWLCVLRIKTSLRKVFLVSGIYFLFFLYIFELLKFYETNINKFFLDNKKTFYQKSEKLILLEKLNRHSIKAYPSFVPRIFNNNEMDLLPLAGVSNVQTVFCKEGPEFSVYQSDRYGFNNPDNNWSKNVNNIIIGDSFAQGACVNEGEDIASRLRDATQSSTLTFGMASNGPLLELASLKEYGQDLNIKNIFWLYFERNDLDDLQDEKKNKLLLKYLEKNYSQSLKKKQSKIDDLVKVLISKEKKKLITKDLTKKEIKKKFAFQKIIRLQILRDKIGFDRGLNFGIDPLFEKIILDAKSFADKKKASFFFVYLPDKESFVSHNLKKDLYKKQEIFEILIKNKINIIDIRTILFDKENDPLSFFAQRIYGHYSAETYFKIAKILESYIKK